MNVGIKVGPRDGIEILKKSKARFVEVWYRVDWEERYRELFDYMKAEKIKFGLHFWGVVEGKYFPNLCYPHKAIAEKTYQLIKKTLNVACREGAFYVNYHPESLRLMELNLDKAEIKLTGEEQMSEEEGYSCLLYYSRLLRADACYSGATDIYIETVPAYVPSHFREGEKDDGRLHPLFSAGLPTKYIIRLGHEGFHLTYDFGHVAGQYPNISRDEIYKKIKEEAKQMAPFTKLVHVNTTIEPLNGTDSHHGVLVEDFLQHVFPSKSQVIELLSIFKNEKDVLIMPEPQQDKMIQNYHELISLTSQLSH